MNNEEVVEEQVETTEAKEEKEGPLSENVQLFKQESYTDGQLLYLDVMTPVKVSKSGKVAIDKDGPKSFIGKSQVDFGGRVMPYTFMIEEAKTVRDAIDQFDNALAKALDRTRERVEEIQKEKEEKEKGKKILIPSQQKFVT